MDIGNKGYIIHSYTWYDRLRSVPDVERLRGGVVERGRRAHGGGVAQREGARDASRKRYLRLPDRARLQLVEPFANPARFIRFEIVH